MRMISCEALDMPDSRYEHKCNLESFPVDVTSLLPESDNERDRT